MIVAAFNHGRIDNFRRAKTRSGMLKALERQVARSCAFLSQSILVDCGGAHGLWARHARLKVSQRVLARDESRDWFRAFPGQDLRFQ